MVSVKRESTVLLNVEFLNLCSFCSRHIGDLRFIVVASAKFLVAMATKVVATWSVALLKFMQFNIKICLTH